MRYLKAAVFAVFVSFFLLPQAARAANYAIDADHTSVTFKVRHLLSWVAGSFKAFDGVFVYDPADPQSWTVNMTIQAESIDTNVAARDKHLKSKDFFETETYPVLTFQSTKVTDVTEQGFKLEGDLTIHGVTKPVVFDVTTLGEIKDPWGNEIAGFTAVTKINRGDFGLTWSKTVETGQLLVGEEIEITLEVAGLKEAA